ncbi:MAG: hypothetical protein IMF15_01315 [Proteobacteria bacterium]|nr:hypothetical protein [Pseudomonadota bacterium]
MTFDLSLIDQAARTIRQRIKTGELSEACCMSSVATPVTEAWDMAQELAADSPLSSEQQQNILKFLNPVIKKQLDSGEPGDFDLIYERLLQLISLP